MTPPELGRENLDFDVAIAGAGLAGASIALQLARGGYRVGLLDASTFPREKTCGEFLSPECWGAFDALGIADDVAGLDYHPIRKARVTTPRGADVVADVVAADGRPGLGLSRWALDDLLVDHARDAGATVFEGARVVGPIIEGARVVGLSARLASSTGPIEVRARVTIAADGRQSALVKQTGRTTYRSWFRAGLVGVKRHLRVVDPDADEAEGTVGLHLVPGGYGGTCRVEGLRGTNLCAMVPESVVKRSRGDLDRVAVDYLGQNPAIRRLLAGSEPIEGWKTVANVRVQASTPVLAGIGYAGDARGTVDPLGGQGMTMALLGAAEAASFLGRALERSGPSTLDEISRWQAAWGARFARRITLCRGFHHVLTRPRVVDLLAGLGPVAPAILAAGFRATRDQRQRGGLVPRPA